MLAKTNVNLNEIRVEIKFGQTDIRSRVDAWIADMKDGRKETMACQEKTEVRLECGEPTSVDMEPEAAHREEEAAVMPVGGLRKRSRDQNLAEGRRGQPKERTRGYCGSRKGVTVGGRRMTRCARVAWRKKGVVRKDWTRSKVERTTQRVGPLRKNLRTLRERVRTRHEGRKGVKDLGGG
jgi:hypothetical protein